MQRIPYLLIAVVLVFATAGPALALAGDLELKVLEQMRGQTLTPQAAGASDYVRIDEKGRDATIFDQYSDDEWRLKPGRVE